MLNKIQKGKRNLIIFGVVILVLTVLCIVGAVLCTLNSEARWWMIVISAVLYVLGIFGILIGITFVWTGAAMKATLGNLKEGNIPLENGTLNTNRCKNCGANLKENDEFCPECGKPASNQKECVNCGAKNDLEARVCTKCGQKFD